MVQNQNNRHSEIWGGEKKKTENFKEVMPENLPE